MYRASDPRSCSPGRTGAPRAVRRLPFPVALIVGALATPLHADRIVLRNLEILRDQAVASFDEDGVRLEDGRTLTWDEIESGRVAEARQDEFDRMLSDLGEPLYRIRQRLKVGDFRALSVPTEAVYPRYVGRRGASAYMVFQATMWSRLASGRREAALEPYLRCLEHLRNVAQADVGLPGQRRLRFDPQTGMTPELLAVWFDRAAAKAAMPGVLQAIKEMTPPLPPAAHVYYGTLALAAGDQSRAMQVLAGLEAEDGTVAELRDVAMAQREVSLGRPGEAVDKLRARVDDLSPATKPLGLYWLGTALIQSDDDQARKQGVLYLLHVPALYGTKHRDLAAAGLYGARETLLQMNDKPGGEALRRELRVNYGRTFHAVKVENQQNSEDGR